MARKLWSTWEGGQGSKDRWKQDRREVPADPKRETSYLKGFEGMEMALVGYLLDFHWFQGSNALSRRWCLKPRERQLRRPAYTQNRKIFEHCHGAVFTSISRGGG
ncbi:predicted protein [Histoplasma capsulatum G186AR]|uniref:Uncharacterized protein n=2 Tax=Ajellomyces capsulatus TaxID=5037 RepID=C0NH03_AJECG|nr:uncharacterized protein HCBG_02625 [Histoplasma capsulatum G186AR]EEH09088.1 predicted protein [Histoplasma capsulatum G186AR]KAG5303595.1 hypothetical protein I7I52_01632 [Histoplasma capsulatum]QSS69192.1 hypothetical protein I7I50_10393 [Histoplasma capsulatum G186AR]